MKGFFVLILSIPSIVLFFRYPEKKEIALQLLMTLVLLFIGWKIVRGGGCLRLLGFLILISGLVAYYFLILSPFLTGKITILGIF